jgi:hypothetical protein
MVVKNTTLGAAKFLVILAELALVLAAAYVFRIEERSSLQFILPLIFLGFAIHAWLPIRARPPFFLALSLVSIIVVLGARDGAWLIAAGGLLFSLCHLPARWRIAALLAAGLVLAASRAEWIPVDAMRRFGTAVVPLLAAMFMFRVIIYLHDRPHEQQRTPAAQRLSYFFMVPNICFPLFPVVDYRTFLREYYSAPASDIYQKGLNWITRGVMHLLLYRLVYYHLAPSFQEVTDLQDVVRYVVSSYLLYLRVSGLFHIAVGVLCLFGYNLPETHRLYFLASSFTDFWRRINIYWKDFAMKILYYPLFMRLRKQGVTQAVMIASAAILICSWMLHSYQTFWLQGVFPLTVQDGVFWSLLGIAVAVNSVLELKGGRARATRADRSTPRDALILSAKTIGMFLCMSLLWSFWSTSVVDEWLAIMAVAASASLREVSALVGVIIALVILGTVIQLIMHRSWVLSSEKQVSFPKAAARTSAVALVAILVSSEQLGQQLTADARSVWASATGRNWLNQRDQEIETRGYYEELLGVEKPRQAVWTQQGALLVRRYFSVIGYGGLADAVQGTSDIRRYELRPSIEISYRGAAFRTNRWGMRDQDYEQRKPAGICRILLFGDSHTMGSGVPDDGTYESLLETRLNRERTDEHCAGYEILNFGVAGYSAVQSATYARKRIPEFEPDVVIYATAQPDLEWSGLRLAQALTAGAHVDDPVLREIVDRAAITPGMNEFQIRQHLKSIHEPLVQWAYRTLAEAAASAGARPIWLFLPRFDLSTSDDDARYRRLASLAQQAGFTTISLAGTYDGLDRSSLQVAPWDKHPNAEANGLIAARLLDVLTDELLSPSEATASWPDT